MFELCHATLYDIMKGLSGLAPLPGRHIVEIAYQMLSAVSCECLHHMYCWTLPESSSDLHSLGIIHADLKLDNIAVKYPETTTIQWLDPLTGFHDKVNSTMLLRMVS